MIIMIDGSLCIYRMQASGDLTWIRRIYTENTDITCCCCCVRPARDLAAGPRLGRPDDSDGRTSSSTASLLLRLAGPRAARPDDSDGRDGLPGLLLLLSARVGRPGRPLVASSGLPPAGPCGPAGTGPQGARCGPPTTRPTSHPTPTPSHTHLVGPTPASSPAEWASSLRAVRGGHL